MGAGGGQDPSELLESQDPPGGIATLRASESRFRFLSELGEATRDVTDPGRIMQTVARLLGEHLGASRCAYAEVDADNDRFTIRHDYTAPGVASTVGEYVLELFGTRAAADQRAGRTLVVHDVDRELSASDGGAMFTAIGIKALVCCPLVKGGRLTAMMAVHQAAPRRWTADEVALVEAVVERSWAYIERARAVRELARSEAELRLVTDAVPQIVWTAGPDGTVDYYNERWYAYTGRAAGERGEPSWAPVVHDDDVDRTRAAWADAVRAGQPYEIEARLRRADGAYRWFLGRAVPLKNEAGEVTRWFGTNTDVHDFKEAQRRARDEAETVETINRVGRAVAAELDLHQLVQQVTDETTALTRAAFGAFFYNVVDEHGKSYALYTLSGVPREAFAQFPMPRMTDIFGPTFRGEAIVRLPDVTADPRYGRNAPYAGMPPGHLPVRSYLAVPVVSRTGAVLGGLFYGHPHAGVFTARDERVVAGIAAQAAVAIDNARLYDALRASRGRAEASLGQLRAIVGSMTEGLIVSDAAGNLLEWNAAALAMHGFASVEEVRRHLAAFTQIFELRTPAGALLELDQWPMSRVLRGETVVGCELSVRRTDTGLELFVSYSGAPVRDADGRVALAILTVHDVTDRKAVERAREDLLVRERAARAEAERASRMKDEFLATLSHELRTPLNAILGWAQILRAGDGTTTADDLSQGLEVIERNARAQTRIIEDLLDMSRIISGKVRLDVQRVDLAPVVRAAVETVQPAADARGIRVQAVLDPAARPVSGDPERLQQVFWNLLSNAIKFTPRGGRVQVLLERVNSHLEVSVTDTGEGIRPEFLPYVFDRFRQADATTTRRHGGLGLGLAIVKQLVELHGGSVRAKSAGPGAGATFIVALPLTAVDAAPAADDEPGERRHPAQGGAADLNTCVQIAGVRVLVVDDEPDARALLARVLEGCQARVRTAGSADEALALLAAERPDVLVSDIGMPGEDGYALIRKVRSLGPDRGGAVPAIALTAYARAEDRMRAVLAGFQMHVAKPVEPAELITMVASLAGRTGG
ncbi:MAG TPA: GAF domain-containing protein [Tepidisphaeraceae bacterium]|nr:GAF domain-containing protein [Tepidisphaeraceae bacterium]